jgi:hypothetical protein
MKMRHKYPIVYVSFLIITLIHQLINASDVLVNDKTNNNNIVENHGQTTTITTPPLTDSLKYTTTSSNNNSDESLLDDITDIDELSDE